MVLATPAVLGSSAFLGLDENDSVSSSEASLYAREQSISMSDTITTGATHTAASLGALGVGAAGLVQTLEGRDDAALGLVRRPGLQLALAVAEQSDVAVGAALWSRINSQRRLARTTREAVDVLELLAAALAPRADAPDLSAVLLEVLQQPRLGGGARVLAQRVVRLVGHFVATQMAKGIQVQVTGLIISIQLPAGTHGTRRLRSDSAGLPAAPQRHRHSRR
jgi:hypothetical protein